MPESVPSVDRAFVHLGLCGVECAKSYAAAGGGGGLRGWNRTRSLGGNCAEYLMCMIMIMIMGDWSFGYLARELEGVSEFPECNQSPSFPSTLIFNLSRIRRIRVGYIFKFNILYLS